MLLLGRDIGFCPGKVERGGFGGTPTAFLMVERGCSSWHRVLGVERDNVPPSVPLSK